jgi:hypothetical protein
MWRQEIYCVAHAATTMRKNVQCLEICTNSVISRLTTREAVLLFLHSISFRAGQYGELTQKQPVHSNSVGPFLLTDHRLLMTPYKVYPVE